jgi:hypothetical protein
VNADNLGRIESLAKNQQAINKFLAPVAGMGYLQSELYTFVNTQSKAKGKPGGTPPVQKGTGSIAKKKKPETKAADAVWPRKPKSKANTAEDDEALIASMISCSIAPAKEENQQPVFSQPRASMPEGRQAAAARSLQASCLCAWRELLKLPQSPFVATMPTITAQTMNSATTTTLASLTTRATTPSTGREDSRNCRPSVRDGARYTARGTCECLQADATLSLADESLPLNAELSFFKECCHQKNRGEARLNALYMRR